MRTVPAILVAAAFGAAVLAGCGGSDDDGKLDHSELVRQANAACKSAEARIAKIPAPSDAAGLASYAASMADATGELHAAIGALKPASPTDQQAIEAYAAGLAKANTALTTMGTAAKAGDTGRIKAQATVIERISVGVLAARAGLSDCATSAAPTATS